MQSNIDNSISFEPLETPSSLSQSKFQQFYSIEYMEGLEEKTNLDVEPPADYHFLRIKDIKHISTARDSSFIKSYLRAVSVKDGETQIQIQLLDKFGNYYYGASEKEWLPIWCSMNLHSIDDSIIKIKEFTITERNLKQDTSAINSGANKQITPGGATVIILDHSGSMGNERALVLQGAAESFIKAKSPTDAIGIIKFDHNVVMECPITIDQALLLQKMKNQRLHFGHTSSQQRTKIRFYQQTIFLC
jgi:hypothetical protein